MTKGHLNLRLRSAKIFHYTKIVDQLSVYQFYKEHLSTIHKSCAIRAKKTQQLPHGNDLKLKNVWLKLP